MVSRPTGQTTWIIIFVRKRVFLWSIELLNFLHIENSIIFPIIVVWFYFAIFQLLFYPTELFKILYVICSFASLVLGLILIDFRLNHWFLQWVVWITRWVLCLIWFGILPLIVIVSPFILIILILFKLLFLRKSFCKLSIFMREIIMPIWLLRWITLRITVILILSVTKVTHPSSFLYSK